MCGNFFRNYYKSSKFTDPLFYFIFEKKIPYYFHLSIIQFPPRGSSRVSSKTTTRKEMILRRLTSGDLASRSLRLLRTSAGGGRCLEEPPYADVPRKGRRWERKPYKTPVKVLIRRAKAEKKERQENPCRILQDPPDNGLVVPELVPVAVRVFSAWRNFLRGFSRVLSNPCFHGSVLRCRYISIFSCKSLFCVDLCYFNL